MKSSMEVYDVSDIQRQRRWDLSFLVDAKVAARRSKDPSTRVGSVIVRPDKTKASEGYNGLPRGVYDTTERLNNRELKYPMVVHAEANALTTAKEALTGYTLYCTHPPCATCAGLIIQSGIKRVVAVQPTEYMISRWGESFRLMTVMFSEAGVELVFHSESDVLLSAMDSGLHFGD